MGVVYRARDETLDRDVAIKFLLPERVASGEASSRFLREARAVARLSHPHIITLYDVGREGAWHFLVLEYIPGRDLHTLMIERGRPFPVPEALLAVRGALAALAYAHAEGIIHRDVKPENIMLTPAGQVKMTDFGLALARGDVRLTQKGIIVGTVLYMAPEMITGAAADNRADLYAVGAVLYELLTGRPPFQADDPLAVLSQVLNAPVPPPRSINARIPLVVEKVVLRLLAKDPARRYDSAAEVLAALPVPADLEAPVGRGAGRRLPEGEPLSLLERIVRASSTLRVEGELAAPREKIQPAERTEEEPLQLTQDLLVHAAFEDTTAAVEAERRHLAGLLQRDVVEPLNLLLAQAKAYEGGLGGNPQARMALSVLTSLARQALQQVRDLESHLHPTTLEALGLEPALESLASQVMRVHGLQVTLAVERMDQRLPPPIELALFRAAQDALGRSARHAHASQVHIRLERQGEQLAFYLSDNGTTAVGTDMLRAARQRVERMGGVVKMGVGPQGGLELSIHFILMAPVELTPREQEVLQLLVEGLSNKEIAQTLSISPRTVNFHLDNLYSKLGVNSRTEAAIYALRHGLIGRSPDPG
jgi:signal transduction histidine kinase/DNA-binding CsgD family transcriptional regulator